MSIGFDHVPHKIKTGSQGRSGTDQTQGIDAAATQPTYNNTASATLENINTYYLNANLTDWLYLKVGYQKMDVKTTETLDTGSAYGDISIDGRVYGLGLQNMSDNGMFFRFEVNQTEYDGGDVITSTKAQDLGTTNTVELTDISGTSARLSIGKSF